MDITKKQDDELLQLVTFSIGDEEFGVDILKVQEIIRTMEITKVPRAEDFVEGVINLRGKVIPIIDLRRRFGLVSKSHDKDTRIIVIEISNMIVGFVVDSVSEVLRIPASTVEPPPRLSRARDRSIFTVSANWKIVCLFFLILTSFFLVTTLRPLVRYRGVAAGCIFAVIFSDGVFAF